jgi:D-beta-D-heptose 7-phosphate kinase/D-beta-D-heptose 1-phosphate adenosyltransferase
MSTGLLVIGDVLLDRDVVGTSERLSPDSHAPVLDVTGVHDRPGGAGLAALLAERRGVTVTLATSVGLDPAGDRVVELLKRSVDVRPVATQAATPGKSRVIVNGRCRLRMDDYGHLLGTGPDAGAAEVDRHELELLVQAADAILVSDYGGAMTADPTVREVVEAAAARVPVVWDPHPRGEEPVRGCRAVTPNRAEAQRFSGMEGDSDLGRVAADLRRRWAATAVCVTDGAHGVVTDEGGLLYRTTAPACPPGVDPCGAGDRFAGAVAVGLGRGADLRSALGAATSEVSAWLTAGGVSGGAVRGVVVATGGCFDVLHAGHLRLLEAAAREGDSLVVLLNSDAGVRRLKGPGRPVSSQADRTAMLLALRCVDAVVVFDEDDPRRALAELRPDVWVKGGDYRHEDLVEAPVVESFGGRVHLVDVLEGRSTSSMLHRLRA